MLGFLPWLPLWSEVSVGQAHFVPFVRGREPFGPDSAEQQIADKILSSFRPNANRPVKRAAIVRYGKHAMTEDLSEEERGQVWEDAEILCLAAISCNEYFCQVGHYANSSLFGVFFQGFGQDADHAVVTTGRRDGHVQAICWTESLNIPPAPGVTLAEGGSFDFDKALIEALCNYRTRRDWERWADGIICFNLANTDSALVRPHMEMVLMLAAFQRVLGVDKEKEGRLAKRFEAVLAPHTPLMVGQSRRCGGNQKREEPLRVRWIRDFYNARGACAHGNLRARSPSPWSTQEFLVLGAFIFPVVVKRLLAADGLYQMTEEDVTKEDAFERLADADIYLRECDQHDPEEEWPWGRILEEVRDEAMLRRAVEYVRHTQGGDQPNTQGDV